ncbi:phage minor structural protein, N-terminal domain protein [Enterococcus faecalis TX4248]|jgi:phage minor structural protein|uniref:Phage minor structural protein, N-terminal domain protein n=1 Tax=Enterococcus faecalis TX4248 TaxID=749495 RepID=A0A125W4N4_ENTFL|nr:phage tail protein [Enterococcus faecalis]EFM82370.1 phage minor structural protein, N-terminal domain protein [Enterococcus faecalis TX4248]MCD5083276.1 phage tail protein [Enterococcus faecalis]
MLMAMDLKREYTAVLDNAYNVGYEKIENQIGNLEFSMPLDDPKNEFLREMLWVELTDNENEYIGLYRVMPSTVRKDASNNSITYTANEALCTLLDTVLFGYHELVNRKTIDVINYLLNKQRTKHWVLKKCEFTRYFSYAWENENGLADALFSIPQAFDEDYMWQWNTKVYPFELSLVKPPKEPIARIQEGYNMQGFEIERDPNNLVNRVYPLGAGEGVNQINIKSVNKNIPYVEDAKSIKEHGLVEYVWVDQRFTVPQALKDNAINMLKKWAQPKISWDVTAADLLKLTDEPLSIDKLRQGTVIMINTDDFGSINLRIKKETKQDVFGAPQDIQLELGNLSDDFTTTMSDLKRKQEINETYSQGATNILNYSYQDNCEKAYPAEIEFFLDDDVFHVNTVELTFKIKRYRGYTKAVKGGGATVKSTSAGGASTQTSSAGGGSVVSSSAGGGGSTTSGSGGGSYQGGSTNTDGGSAQTSSANGSHDHLMFNVIQGPPQTLPKITLRAGGGGEIYTEARGGTFRTASAADNHTHTVNVPSHSHRFNIDIPAHTHSVSIPNHTHSISVPSHSHQVRIPAHTHQITLPDHSHPLEWGIYEAPSSATSVDIVVDGTTIPIHDTSQQRLNIVNYLRKTSGGKISRGNHTIKIIPNKLARIEAQVICRVFIQSQLGGQF